MLVEEKYNVEKHFRLVEDIVCGPEEESLREYLLMDAHRENEENIAKVYLLFNKTKKKKELIGFYALSVFGFAYKDNKIMRYLPCLQISNLLVDFNKRRKGFGTVLMYKAVEKAKKISKLAGCKAMIVFSLNKESTKFYKSFGFEDFYLDKKYLIIPDTGYNEGLPLMVCNINKINERNSER